MGKYAQGSINATEATKSIMSFCLFVCLFVGVGNKKVKKPGGLLRLIFQPMGLFVLQWNLLDILDSITFPHILHSIMSILRPHVKTPILLYSIPHQK